MTSGASQGRKIHISTCNCCHLVQDDGANDRRATEQWHTGPHIAYDFLLIGLPAKSVFTFYSWPQKALYHYEFTSMMMASLMLLALTFDLILVIL